MSKPLKMILSLPVAPENRSALVEHLKVALVETRRHDGCSRATIWLPDHDDGRVWVHEEWASREHQARYISWRTDTGALQHLASMTSGPPDFIWLQEIEPAAAS